MGLWWFYSISLQGDHLIVVFHWKFEKTITVGAFLKESVSASICLTLSPPFTLLPHTQTHTSKKKKKIEQYTFALPHSQSNLKRL